MANQPVFRADPNAVPQINGWPGVINSIQKGYQLAQLPQQMKMQQMLQAAQLQKYQAETEGQNLNNQYYGQEAEQRIAASKAGADYQNKQTSRYDETINSALARDRVLNANTQANTGLTNEQLLAARLDRQQTADFYKALGQGQAGQGAPQQQGGGYYDNPPQQAPLYQPGQGGAMYAPQKGAPQQQGTPGAPGMQQPAPQQQTQGNGAQGNGAQTYVVQEGDPNYYKYDQLASNPLYAKQLAKLGIPAPKTTTTFNGTSGLMVTTTQLPSGRITTTTTPVSNGSNGIITSYDDQGRPVIKIGGSASGSRGQGGLSTDADGNLISNPTTTTQTNLQQRDIGKDVAVPYLNELADNLPQFQNVGKRALTAGEGLLNNLGANFSAPSQKATGEAAITLASEGLLKAFGLYGAHANIEEVKATLRPQWGESKKGYEKRIQNYKADTINNAVAQKEKLAGIKVRENKDTEKEAVSDLSKINDANGKNILEYKPDELKAMREHAS